MGGHASSIERIETADISRINIFHGSPSIDDIGYLVSISAYYGPCCLRVSEREDFGFFICLHLQVRQAV